MAARASPTSRPCRRRPTSWPGWMPQNVVNLGLDLRGGVHLLVDVQVEEVFNERLQGLRRAIFDELREAGIDRKITLQDDRRHRRDHRTRPTWRTPATILNGLAAPDRRVLRWAAAPAGATSTSPQVPGGYTITLSEAGSAEITDRTMPQSLEIMRRRIDETGTREPVIQRQGDRRILIQVPGLGSSQELLDIIGKTAKLSFHDVVAAGAEARNPGPNQMRDAGRGRAQPYLLDRTPILTGENLTDAQLGFHAADRAAGRQLPARHGRRAHLRRLDGQPCRPAASPPCWTRRSSRRR